MKILAFDTSTMTVTAAVLDGEAVRAAAEAASGQRDEALMPLVDRVLGEAGLGPGDLDAVACGVGPGSYTGLRIGVATAKGLCFALEKPLVAVSSLAALAWAAADEARAAGAMVLATTDARRGELYGALFDLGAPGSPGAGAPRALLEDAVFTPEALVAAVRAAEPARPILVVGDGLALEGPRLLAAPGFRAAAHAGAASATPRAEAVARIALARLAAGASDELGSATPAYLRLTPAEEKFPPRG